MIPMLTPTQWTVRISNGSDAWEDLAVEALSVEFEDGGFRFYEEYEETVLFVPIGRVIFLQLGS